RAAIAANASGDEARALPRPPAGLARMRLRSVAIRCSWPSPDDGARSAERPRQTPSTVGPDPTQSPIRTAGRSFGGHRPALECKRGRIPRRPVLQLGPHRLVLFVELSRLGDVGCLRQLHQLLIGLAVIRNHLMAEILY